MNPANRLPPIGVKVMLRIPGSWKSADQFFADLPADCRSTERSIILADGSEFQVSATLADPTFPQLFAAACLKLPTPEERERIENFRINVCLAGPGGSVSAAKGLMTAAAAVLTAGGAGVFVENGGVAHGAEFWLLLLEKVDKGRIHWAFVNTVRNETQLYSTGMHALGLRDVIVPATGDEQADLFNLHHFLRYTVYSGVKLKHGVAIGRHVLPDRRVLHQADDLTPPGLPRHNPFGRWRLEPIDVSQN